MNLPFADILADAINNAIGIDNVFDNTQPNQEMNFSLSQLDNVDFNNLSISDIVKVNIWIHLRPYLICFNF